MQYLQIVWDDEDDPDGNVQHIAEHDLTIEDVDFVLEHSATQSVSRTTGRPCCFGYTPSGDFIIVIYDEPIPGMIYPITAYQVPEHQ